ncbi:MAG: cache domain-containing protein [Opitutaceae bacterium]
MPSPSANGYRPADLDWWWIFDPRISLRARSALVLGGSAIVFTLLVSWLAGLIMQRQLENQLGPSFQTLAGQLSDKLDRYLYERYRSLQLAAELAPFRSGPFSQADYRRWTKSILDLSPDLAWVGFADTTGRIVGATPRLLENAEVESERWFRSAREKPYFGPVRENPDLARQLRLGPEDGVPRFLDAALPVRAIDGTFIGVLVAQLRWSEARELQLSVIPDTARLRWLGITVYNPNGEVLLDSGASGWSEPPASPLAARLRGSRGHFVEKTPLGTIYLTGYVRSTGVREFQGLGWHTVVRQPVNHAFAPVYRLRRSLVSFGFLFAGALVVVSWWYAGRMTRRLGSVEAAARKIRAGDILTVMPSAHNEGEVDRMCGAVAELVEDFRRKEAAHAPPLTAGPGEGLPEKPRPNPALRELPW